MKIGLHLSMLCQKWTDDVSIYLEDVKKAGFDGVEISLYKAVPEQLQRVVKKAQELGFDIYFGTGVDETTDPSSELEPTRRNALNYLKHCIDIAAAAQAVALQGVLYAPWQKFSSLDQKQRWRYSADVIREAGKYAGEKGLSLHVEVVNRFETDFMNTLDEGAEFLKLIALDNVQLLADIFHMNIEEDSIPQALQRNIGQIGCMHISENHRGVCGSGHIDWMDLIGCLKQLQYDGYLIMETFTKAGSEVGDGMCIRRNRSSSTPLQEAVFGIQYLKGIEGYE